MKSQMRLKVPFFITFNMEGIEREEAVRFITFNSISGVGEPFPGYQDVDDMLRRLDVDDHGEEALTRIRDILSHSDLDCCLREAYLEAEYRARDYCWAAARRDQSEPCPTHVPTLEERKAIAFGHVREYLDNAPADVELKRQQLAKYLADHPDEAVRRNAELEGEMKAYFEENMPAMEDHAVFMREEYAAAGYPDEDRAGTVNL